MKRNWRILAIKRFCLKSWCKHKQNAALSEYFKDKLEEQENKPKNLKEHIIKTLLDIPISLKNDFVDTVNKIKVSIIWFFWDD